MAKAGGAGTGAWGIAFPLLLLLLLPAGAAAGDHPYPDVYIHYHLDIARGRLTLSHETRWTDLVAVHLVLDLDRNRDGRTTAAETAPFVGDWVESVRRNFQVTLNGTPLELPPPSTQDESLTWYAEGGRETMLQAEWEIDLQFDIPLPPGEVPGRLVLEERAYEGEGPEEPDTYWVTNEIAVVGEEGLRIRRVSELPEPRLITRRIEVAWDWQGKGMAWHFAGAEQNPDQEDRERLGELLERMGRDGWFLPVALLLALFYGMGHALAPGHGKAMVAGYLVGSRGTIRDAILLGLVVTFTHTAMVFLFALVIYFMRDSFNNKAMEAWLGVASGGLITMLGLWLLWRRFPRSGPPETHHHVEGGSDSHHHHHHHHNHHHHHPVALDRVSLPQLLWLGVSGGIVPCPAALVVLLLSMRTARPVYGLLLVGAFSIGLAGVLVAIGMLMVTSRGLLDRLGGSQGRLQPLLRLLPPLSAACVAVVGLIIARDSWPLS